VTSALTADTVRAEDRAVLSLQRTPAALHAVEDLDAGPGVPALRVYRPRPGPLRAVLFLHGGGFVIGREGYEAPLRDLAAAGDCLLVCPACRLAPEHPFPAAADDALAAMRWLAAHAEGLGASPGPPGIAGDSSGGNLAAGVTHALCRDGAPPSFQLLIYPMLDATAGSPSYRAFATDHGFSADKARWYFDQYLPPGIDRRDPRVSPLFDRPVAGLPPTLVVTAERDPVRDDGERHVALLRAEGAPAELRRHAGTTHGFFQATGAPEGAKLHAELGDWLREHAPG